MRSRTACYLRRCATSSHETSPATFRVAAFLRMAQSLLTHCTARSENATSHAFLKRTLASCDACRTRKATTMFLSGRKTTGNARSTLRTSVSFPSSGNPNNVETKSQSSSSIVLVARFSLAHGAYCQVESAPPRSVLPRRVVVPIRTSSQGYLATRDSGVRINLVALLLARYAHVQAAVLTEICKRQESLVLPPRSALL